MKEDTIHKPESIIRQANMPDYDVEARRFSWRKAKSALPGMPDAALNIAYIAIDRHAQGKLADKVALRWLGKNKQALNITYLDLQKNCNRFANILYDLGLEKGERVYSLLGRVPELYITALGSLKAGCVYCPLFSAFGPEPIRSRMSIGGANVLVTSKSLYRKKVVKIRDQLPDLKHVLIVDDDGKLDDVLDLQALLKSAQAQFNTVPTDPEDLALLHFTSGTTGTPKGAMHVHEAVITHYITGQIVLDLKPDDIYWCTADPGWVTGTSYGIIAPLSNGVTMIVDEAEFDAQRWYRILQEERVNVWYTAPTAIRMLMKAGRELADIHRFADLRFMASVGEPLNPEAVVWGNEVFGMPFHDNWWQTETGGIMIANYAAMAVKPGSMGKPLPGISAGIVKKSGTSLEEISSTGEVGELALREGWPSMMRGYLNNPVRYDKCFADGWYLSGDLAMRDSDGYFWFVGRDDDVIKSAGHLIGPFEVESALMEHAAVAEAGVIGIPDDTVGEVVKAFVALKPGYITADALRLELLGYARKRLGPSVAPKEIEFRDSLPKTRSGKIMRRLLKARELGLPEGDISTLESDES